MKVSLVATAVASVLVLGPIPLAHADSTDDAYLAKLQSMGVPINGDAGAQRAIQAGERACDLKESGYSDTQTIGTLQRENPKINSNTIVAAITAAMLTYCPNVSADPWSPGG